MIFLLGLAKKLVLADMFARFADVGFNRRGAWRAAQLRRGLVRRGILRAADLLRLLRLFRHGDRLWRAC